MSNLIEVVDFVKCHKFPVVFRELFSDQEDGGKQKLVTISAVLKQVEICRHSLCRILA